MSPAVSPLPQSVPPAGSGRVRLPLGGSRRRLSYDLRLRLWIALLAAPTVVCTGVLVWRVTASAAWGVATGVVAVVAFAITGALLFEQLTRPLQTLSNVVAALHEDDFSFRARGARRGDSLGDLALEINALAGTLQGQRNAARDALTLAERVMQALRAPVLAFAPEGTLRLLNPAAEAAFGLRRERSLGLHAEVLGLLPLFQLQDGDIYAQPADNVSGAGGETRWSLRRSSFRLQGLPHSLFVLADVDAALREEERVAWQRLVRVLSHEINNSLTPITSLAGSLRARLPMPDGAQAAAVSVTLENVAQLQRGLHLIEDRAVSLHRFLDAYGQLTRLPRPTLQSTELQQLLDRVVALETRVPVQLHAGGSPQPRALLLDPAQIEQLLINLLRNAAEASMAVQVRDHEPRVEVFWWTETGEVVVRLEDNGPGLPESRNLFVPFYTTKPGGSGIGLVLAQQIAQGHGGSLTLSNHRERSGCRAELRLPLRYL